MSERVVIYTDGACKGNPGPGGWGAWLRWGAHEKELFGGEPATTNNRMELTAVIESLALLKRHTPVAIYTDSEYLKNGITRWHQGWVRKNWRSASGDPVKNMDLWQRILDVCKIHQIEWHWVRSHVGIPLNERADKLATAARDEGMATAKARRKKPA